MILVPLLLGAAGPGWLVEAGWQLGWVVVGVAAVEQAQPALGPLPNSSDATIGPGFAPGGG